MTEKTAPELPVTLATDNEATSSLTLCKNAGGFHYVRARNAKADCSITVYVDPAELMRNLAAFVPEVEPVAWLDEDAVVFTRRPDGRVWRVGTSTYREAPLSHWIALYAHPPVTAEPATAPSVEQIFKTIDDKTKDWIADNDRVRALAEEIRTLYGTPGDKGESISEGDYNAMHERARKAEALAESVTSEADAVHRIANHLRAEVERHKAEAARQERRADEWKDQWRFVLGGAMQEAAERIELDLVMQDIKGDVARAAVEAETSEEPCSCGSRGSYSLTPGEWIDHQPDVCRIIRAETSEEAGA